MRRSPARSIRPAGVALLAAAIPLSGCFTPRVRPAPSKAVLEARAHKDVDGVSACAELASPLSVGFGFGEASLSELAAPAVERAGQALACHPGAAAVIVGQADGHGTDADQMKLAQARADAVAEALRGRGVAPGRLQIQAQGSAPGGDAQHLVILAEGRRW